MQMNYVIGVDGGGTKTDAILAETTGVVIARAIGGPTNPNLISKEQLLSTFKMLFQRLYEQAPMAFDKVTLIFAGVSGAGSSDSQRQVHDTIAKLVLRNVEIQVVPDSVNALYSGTYGKPGIVQISGTGSITYGLDHEGRESRVGGWGYLFGDEGSGYDIGRRGIQAVLKCEDGLSSKTVLTDMLFSRFHVSTTRDLIQKIVSSDTPKDCISPTSELVFNAYKEGDIVAQEIITSVCKEISACIIALYKKSFIETDCLPVVLVGGVFTDKNILPSMIQRELLTVPNLTVTLPELPPVGGSLIGAYIHEGKIPSERIVATILKTLKEGAE